MRFFILLPLLLLMSVPAQAQTKYAPWSNPDQKTGAGAVDVQEFIKRLDKLIDDAEKSRAADPAFLRDLRDLARSYDAAGATSQPGIRTVLSDDFSDGDFTANPAWTVDQGKYWVEKGWGLRSAVAVQGQMQQQQKKLSDRETALAILGAVLNQSGGGTTAGAPTEQAMAGIYTPAAIGNAFTIDLEFSSWVQQGQPSGGRLDIGPYQGNDRASGYRLTYSPGEGLSLLSVSPSGSRVIDQSIGPMTLEDKKTHALRWSRDTHGRMKISVDGREILNTLDRGFGDPFQGLTMSNRGGDYIVKRITVGSAN